MKGGATMEKLESARVTEENETSRRCDDRTRNAIQSALSEESQQARAFDVVLREAAAHGRRHRRIQPAPDPEPDSRPPTAEIVRELYAALKRRWERSGVR